MKPPLSLEALVETLLVRWEQLEQMNPTERLVE